MRRMESNLRVLCFQVTNDDVLVALYSMVTSPSFNGGGSGGQWLTGSNTAIVDVRQGPGVNLSPSPSGRKLTSIANALALPDRYASDRAFARSTNMLEKPYPPWRLAIGSLLRIQSVWHPVQPVFQHTCMQLSKFRLNVILEICLALFTPSKNEQINFNLLNSSLR